MLQITASLLLLVIYLAPASAQVTDPNFVLEDVDFHDNGMTAIDFLPDGKMLVTEKQGRILLYTPDGSGGFNGPTVFGDLSSQVDPDLEAGMLGLAVDPEFAANKKVFLFYTTSGDQRVSTILANASNTAMVPASETVLLAGFPRDVTFHKAGDIEFQPGDDQNLYIALGDDGGSGLVEIGGVPRVQLPDFYYGKILKVDKNTGRGLAGNPFYAGDTDTIRARVWAVGFRNPFRFCFHPDVPDGDVLYSSENGDATDKISWVRKGSNGAWSADGDGGGFLNPPDTNHHVMITRVPSQIGIAIATGGPFAVNGVPTLYSGNWFPAPFGIYRWHLTGGNLDGLTPIAGDPGARLVEDRVAVDLTFGPDGALYFCETGGGAAVGGFFPLWRLRFVGGTPPVASFTSTPSPATGEIPFLVNFTDTSTVDPGATLADWFWSFGDGINSESQHPSHTYLDPGVYTVSLTVTDSNGLENTTTATTTAFRSVELTLNGQIFDGGTSTAVPLAAATELNVYQADGITPVPFGALDGNSLAVSPGGTILTTISLEITDDGAVISAGEPPGDGVESARVGIGIPRAQAVFTATTDFYLSPTMVSGQITDMRGAPVFVDLGTARGSAGSFIDVAGGRDVQQGPLTGTNHRTESDDLGFYHVPIPVGTANIDFFFDLVADTGTQTFASQTNQQFLGEGMAQVIDYMVGRFGGGLDCTDLSAIAATPNVDYATQIQTIWDANCTGCHNAVAANSAGLDLTGDSFSNLFETPSNQVPGLFLIDPQGLDHSYLFEKINCQNPQFGSRMRPSETMNLPDQALIRDWITQMGPFVCSALNATLPAWPDTSRVPDLVMVVTASCGTP